MWLSTGCTVNTSGALERLSDAETPDVLLEPRPSAGMAGALARRDAGVKDMPPVLLRRG